MKVTLLLGSNLGDSKAYLARAVELLIENLGELVQTTTVHTSRAWGYKSECIYFNQIIVCQTNLAPRELLDRCECIEAALGRVKDEKMDWQSDSRPYQDRIIDIDILYYTDDKGKNIEYSDERLKIPHPRIEERDFTKILLEELSEGKLKNR